MANSNTRQPTVGSVSTRVEIAQGYDGPYVWLIVMGTVKALLASGYLTPSLLEIRAARIRGDSRFMRDEHGRKFGLQRAPTRDEPERMRLGRVFDIEIARQMPGVRELLPKIIPGEVQAERVSSKARPSYLRLVVDNTKETEHG